MIELKPCPFCGGNDIQIDEMESFWDKNETIWRVLCINCIAETAGDTKEQAIAAWNRRSDAVPVVRCKDCVWWQDRQVQLADGSCRDYMPDEPWSVTCDIGINVGSHCTKHGFDDKSGSWFWANENDYCSRGAKMGGKP